MVRAPGLGRITGSASIETLVRVGLEKEAGLSPDSKMVVLHDFTPCVDDELEVKRGSVSVISVCPEIVFKIQKITWNDPYFEVSSQSKDHISSRMCVSLSAM